MTRYQGIAYRLRWLVLIVGLLCLAAGVFWLTNPLWPQWEVFSGPMDIGAGLMGVMGWWFADQGTPKLFDHGYGPVLAGYLGVFLLTQWLLLAPRRDWQVRLARTGRPMKRAVISAGLIGAVLTVGLFATIMEVGGWWLDFIRGADGPDEPQCWLPLCAMAIAWIAWSAVFFVYWRQGDRYTQLGKMIRGLLAGSFLELIAATAVYAWDPHEQQECYCFRGSYTGLVLGGTVALWCFGPGIVLLFMREKYRRRKFSLCLNCGYDLRGSIPAGATTCPECGAAIG